MATTNNNTEAKTKIFYSDYGYITVNEADLLAPEVLVSFTRNNITGTIKDKISINLKGSHGERRNHYLEVDIHSKISEIIIKLCIEEDNLKEGNKNYVKWDIMNQFRLISTNGKIKQLDPNKTLFEENIKDNEHILLLQPTTLSFSETMKGSYIILDGANTAYKAGSDDLQLVLTDNPYRVGRNYCEIILETEPAERSIIVGLTTSRNDFYLNLSDFKGFWGYILSECKKICIKDGKVDTVEYGDLSHIKDRIGILVSFNESGADVNFFINKVNLGTAFTGLPHDVYYPCVGLGYDGSKVKITNKVSFPEGSLEI